MNSISPSHTIKHSIMGGRHFPKLINTNLTGVADKISTAKFETFPTEKPVSHRFNSVFSSKPWIEVLNSTYGFKIKSSARFDKDNATAAILFSEISDIRGRRIISLPFSDYCDPLVETEADWQMLISPILELQIPVRFKLVFNPIPLADQRFSQQTCALWHGVDLSLSEEILWKRLKGAARRNIEKAHKNGVVIRESNSLEDLRSFYNLHCHVRKSKYGLLAQPFTFFENIHKNFAPSNSISIMIAEREGVAIAGVLFLIHENTLYYKFNASKDLEFRPNDLLVWSGIVLGRKLGLHWLDFGLSDLEQPGLVTFKRKFATHERNITQLLWTPPGYRNPGAQQAGQLLGELTKLLTAPDVPESVALASSNLLYRFFC